MVHLCESSMLASFDLSRIRPMRLFVCMQLYTCFHTCVCFFVSLFLLICLCRRVCVGLSMCEQIHAHRNVYVLVLVFVLVLVLVFACVCVCVCVFAVCICCLFACLIVFVFVFVSQVCLLPLICRGPVQCVCSYACKHTGRDCYKKFLSRTFNRKISYFGPLFGPPVPLYLLLEAQQVLQKCQP